MKIYAGIGSRETPNEILKLMKQISRHLAYHNYILRSGGANGADQAFENGCDEFNGQKEIYLPWSGFANSKSALVVQEGEAYRVAERYHPYWHNLSNGAKKLQARNSLQVLGQDLKTPCDFVVCYTSKGSGRGGTGQALRIAKDYQIPIFDCGNYEHDLELLKNKYREFYKTIAKEN